MLRYVVILAFVSQSVEKYLNIEVSAGKKECFFLYKKYGEWIAAEIRSVDDFDISFWGPNENHILTKQRVRRHRVTRQTSSEGDYGFCFYNSYNFRSSILVSFEYDYEVDSSGNPISHEEKILDELISEKEKIWTSVMEKIGIRNDTMKEQVFLDTMKEMTENNVKGKNNDPAYMQRSLALLSLHADQMKIHLKYYKSRRIRHFHLQESNNFNVMMFSIMMCSTIVISGLIQVIMIKGIFGISVFTWKFWRY